MTTWNFPRDLPGPESSWEKLKQLAKPVTRPIQWMTLEFSRMNSDWSSRTTQVASGCLERGEKPPIVLEPLKGWVFALIFTLVMQSWNTRPASLLIKFKILLAPIYIMGKCRFIIFQMLYLCLSSLEINIVFCILTYRLLYFICSDEYIKIQLSLPLLIAYKRLPIIHQWWLTYAITTRCNKIASCFE